MLFAGLFNLFLLEMKKMFARINSFSFCQADYLKK